MWRKAINYINFILNILCFLEKYGKIIPVKYLSNKKAKYANAKMYFRENGLPAESLFIQAYAEISLFRTLIEFKKVGQSGCYDITLNKVNYNI